MSDDTMPPPRMPSVNFWSVAIVACLFVIYLYRNLLAWPAQRPGPPSSQQADGIPPKIWQIALGDSSLDDLANLVQTWPTKNKDFTYTLLSDHGADAFARKHYRTRPHILETFLDLQIPILRSDMLRYMLLETEGGIYGDLDTRVMKPFSEWIPPTMKEETRAIVGVEYDQGSVNFTFGGMHEPIQLCQWTMASVPGHPIMTRVVSAVAANLQTRAKNSQTTIAEMKIPLDDVLTTTGPVVWTRAVYEHLSDLTGTSISHLNFTGMTEPKLVGDTLVLPINGFGSGQPHSNSYRGEGDAPDGLVRHTFKGSWKEGWPKG
ncbi:MAG: hypothetical protein Q9211_004305 [Gyalolechia sp. 1 TL-2023]